MSDHEDFASTWSLARDAEDLQTATGECRGCGRDVTVYGSEEIVGSVTCRDCRP